MKEESSRKTIPNDEMQSPNSKIHYFYPRMRLRQSLFGLTVLLCGLCSMAQAQLFVGANAGGILGRTVDAGLLYYPKNEDWIAVSLSGGYTVYGPMYFARREADCVRHFHNSGAHVRLGLRNGLTTDHHANHVFWGADLIYGRQNENAIVNNCDSTKHYFAQKYAVMSGSINIGYTWNPLRRKTIYQRILIDFGLRMGFPFWSSAPPLGERDYYSGLGFTWFPIRKIAFEPIAAIRFELFHSPYGYSKGKTRKRYK